MHTPPSSTARRIARHASLLTTAIVLGAAVWGSAAAQRVNPAAPGYHQVSRVTLGGNGFWDYLTFDSADHRLFVAHGDRLLAVDPNSGRILGAMTGLHGIHGVAVAPGTGRAFVTEGRTNDIVAFAPRTLQRIGAPIPAAKGPDGIIYDPATREVVAMDGDGGALTMINPRTDAVTATVPLNGSPEFSAADGRGMIFTNLEDSSVVRVIDARTHQVVNTWALGSCHAPSAMAIDRVHRRVFVGCHNQLLVVLNADNGQLVATEPIGMGVDAARFDPGTGLVFASTGDGHMTVIHEETRDTYRVVQTVTTERGARTMALDPATHRFYVVTAEFGPAPAPTAARPHPRPTIVPGSFTLLAYAPGA